MRIFGKGFHFGQDGPGNRLVYHLSGCNLRCPWCSNPEGMDGTAGTETDRHEVLDECLRCRPMFFEGGGVTFTGGEATLWYDELRLLLPQLQKAGIHTALETNGTSAHLSELLPFVDYLMMDCKHDDPAAHKRFTGIDNAVILKNFERIFVAGRQIRVRVPLINGVNADRAKPMAEWFASHGADAAEFEFLPYHEYGRDKWKTPYQMKNAFVSAQTVKAFTDTFASRGLTVVNANARMI